MATKRQRAFAAFGAALFLITSSALTIAVIISLTTSSSSSSSNANASKPSSSTTTNNSSSSSSKTNGGKMLAGTKLSNFTPTSSIPSLQTIDETVGTGQTVQPGDTVTVNYTGAVASTGIIFQSSLDSGKPVSFPLNSVIEGWTKGIPGMKVGGTRRLLIPASEAYGANPPQGSGIPANADLVFDVSVLSIGSSNSSN